MPSVTRLARERLIMSEREDEVWFAASVINALEDLSDDLEGGEVGSSEELREKGVGHLLDELALQYGEVVDAEKETRHGFETRLYYRWGAAFDVLEFFIMLNEQTGRLFTATHGDAAEEEDDALLNALIKLHARACQVAREVLALMRAGYADGAFSRWRAIFETTATAKFIAEKGEDTAIRFLNHRVVDDYFELKSYREHREALGFEPVDEEKWVSLENLFEELVDEYGGVFKTSYGWAAPDLDEDPSRRAVVDAVDLEKYHPYFAFASDTVHGGSKGTQFRLGLSEDTQNEILLVGPSNTGFTDPAQYTVLMLLETTGSLLTLEEGIHWTVISSTLSELVDEVIGTFNINRLALEFEIDMADGNRYQMGR